MPPPSSFTRQRKKNRRGGKRRKKPFITTPTKRTEEEILFDQSEVWSEVVSHYQTLRPYLSFEKIPYKVKQEVAAYFKNHKQFFDLSVVDAYFSECKVLDWPQIEWLPTLTQLDLLERQQQHFAPVTWMRLRAFFANVSACEIGRAHSEIIFLHCHFFKFYSPSMDEEKDILSKRKKRLIQKLPAFLLICPMTDNHMDLLVSCNQNFPNEKKYMEVARLLCSAMRKQNIRIPITMNKFLASSPEWGELLMNHDKHLLHNVQFQGVKSLSHVFENFIFSNDEDDIVNKALLRQLWVLINTKQKVQMFMHFLQKDPQNSQWPSLLRYEFNLHFTTVMTFSHPLQIIDLIKNHFELLFIFPKSYKDFKYVLRKPLIQQLLLCENFRSRFFHYLTPFTYNKLLNPPFFVSSNYDLIPPSQLFFQFLFKTFCHFSNSSVLENERRIWKLFAMQTLKAMLGNTNITNTTPILWLNTSMFKKAYFDKDLFYHIVLATPDDEFSDIFNEMGRIEHYNTHEIRSCKNHNSRQTSCLQSQILHILLLVKPRMLHEVLLQYKTTFFRIIREIIKKDCLKSWKTLTQLWQISCCSSKPRELQNFFFDVFTHVKEKKEFRLFLLSENVSVYFSHMLASQETSFFFLPLLIELFSEEEIALEIIDFLH